MSDRMAVDPERLKRVAESMTDLSSQAGAVHAKLDSVLAATNSCWGSDTGGLAFESNYVPARDKMKAELDGLRAQITGLKDELVDLAENYARVEETNKQVAPRIS